MLARVSSIQQMEYEAIQAFTHKGMYRHYVLRQICLFLITYCLRLQLFLCVFCLLCVTYFTVTYNALSFLAKDSVIV